MNAVLGLWRLGTIELVRSRLYAGLLVAGLFMTVAAVGFAELSVGEYRSSLINVGLAFVSLVSSVLAMAVAISSMSRLIESRQVIALLSRPVPRYVSPLGRFGSVATLVLASNVVLGAVLAGFVRFADGPALRVFVAVVANSGEGLIVAAIAVLTATRLSGALSAVLTIGVFGIGRMDVHLLALIDKGMFGPVTPMFRVAHHVFPQLSRYDLTAWVHDGSVGVGAVLWTCGYTVLYVFAVLLLALKAFEKRDLL